MEIVLKQNKAYPNEYFLAIKDSDDFLLKMELLGVLKGEHETAVSILNTITDALLKDTPDDVDCTRYLNPVARRATKDIIESLGMRWQTKPTPLDK